MVREEVVEKKSIGLKIEWYNQLVVKRDWQGQTAALQIEKRPVTYSVYRSIHSQQLRFIITAITQWLESIESI